VAIPLTAVFLDVTNYVPNAAEQPASALLGIRLLMGPIPAVLLTIAIVFAIRYPLDRDSYSQVVAELEERRAKA
jgi:glycoside/pentoside/hexuronide:cation symporter, GPH family